MYIRDGLLKLALNSCRIIKSEKAYLLIQIVCINRVVVPEELRRLILKSLHECHTGIVRMKMMARSYVWRPLCDKDIESYVSNCITCQQTQPVAKVPIKSKWAPTTYPFERVHIDFFFVFLLKKYLL